MQFRHFLRLVAAHHVKLADFHFLCLLLIVQYVIGLQYARIYLNQRIFADERIGDCLKYVCALCLCYIIVTVKDLIRLHIDAFAGTLLRAGEILDDII